MKIKVDESKVKWEIRYRFDETALIMDYEGIHWDCPLTSDGEGYCKANILWQLEMYLNKNENLAI